MPVIARRLWITLAALMFLATPLRAGTAAPAQFVKDFYGWYLSALGSPTRDVMNPNNGLKRYVTPALLRRLRSADAHSGPAGTDMDYFMQSQNLDPAFQAKHVAGWQTRITSKAVRSSKNTATVKVLFKGIRFDKAVQVQLVHAKDGWRIDSVNSARS